MALTLNTEQVHVTLRGPFPLGLALRVGAPPPPLRGTLRGPYPLRVTNTTKVGDNNIHFMLIGDTNRTYSSLLIRVSSLIGTTCS